MHVNNNHFKQVSRQRQCAVTTPAATQAGDGRDLTKHQHWATAPLLPLPKMLAALEYTRCIPLILSVHCRKPRIRGIGALLLLVTLFSFEIASVCPNRADTSLHSRNPNPLSPHHGWSVQVMHNPRIIFHIRTESEYARWQMEAG